MRFCSRIAFSRLAADRRYDGHPARRVPPVRPQPSPATAVRRLRDRWPFLDDPSTPVELQALVTQRITRYHEYTGLYARLRSCDSTEECAGVAGRLLDAYLDGRAIARELDYYQQHGKVLGRHPLFRHFQQLARLRSSSVKDLLREQQKTKDNIWRVNSEIRKGDKPHLDVKRRQKLAEYQLKLQEINRLLGE